MRAAWIILGWVALMTPLQVHGEAVMAVADRLAGLHLPYRYGSADPRDGGFDCSGFVQMVFREGAAIELPDEADKQLAYCRGNGQVWDASSAWTPETLQPGDLIFFAGPEPRARTSQVSHVMIYCGHNIMVGAQTQGRQLNGASAGVGYYYHPFRRPYGVPGESGDRFVGQGRVFAYARLKTVAGTLPQATLATLLPLVSQEEAARALAGNAQSRYD